MAWEGNVDPAEEPVLSDTEENGADDSAESSATGTEEACEPRCSGSEDDKTDEEDQETAAEADLTDESTPQKTIPRRRLPLLGRVPARCLPFWAAEFAAALTKGLTPIQMNVLGAFIATVGDAVSLIAAKAEIEEDEDII